MCKKPVLSVSARRGRKMPGEPLRVSLPTRKPAPKPSTEGYTSADTWESFHEA